jgi:glycosyltransferase involved in cell wall biosynthesis
MAEVAGQAAMLVDPLSVDEMAGALTALLSSEDFRAELSRRGILQAALFSREKMMAKFGEILTSLAPGKAA